MTEEYYPFPLYCIISEIVKPLHAKSDDRNDTLFDAVRWMVCYFQSEAILESGIKDLAKDLFAGGVPAIKTMEDIEDFLLTYVDDENIVTQFKQQDNNQKDLCALADLLNQPDSSWEMLLRARVEPFWTE